MSRNYPSIHSCFRYLLLIALSLLLGCQSAQRWTTQAQELFSLDRIPILKLSKPDSVKAHAHFMHGKILEMEQKTEAALDSYSKALKIEPENFPLTLKVARGKLALRQFDEAIKVLEKSTSQPSPPAEIYALLGFAYSSVGNVSKGKSMVERAIEIDPSNILAHQTLAELHIRFGETEIAQGVLDQILAQEFVDYTSLLKLMVFIEDVSKAEAWSPTWTQPRMLEILKRLEDYVSERPLLLVEIADRYWELGQAEKAIALYYEALEQFPSLTSRCRKILAYFLQNNRWEEALELVNRLISLEPDEQLWYVTKADILNQLQRFSEAESALLEAIVKDPEKEAVYLQLARIQFSQGKLDMARDSLRAADEKFKPDFDRTVLSAYIELSAENEILAVQYFEEAEKLGQLRSGQGLNHVFYFQMAVVYEASKNYQKASEALLQSLAIKSNFAEAMNFLGYMWADQNMRLAEARVYIEKALKLEPDNPAFQDSMAWVLYRLGDYAGALLWIEKSRKGMSEADPVILDHLGDIQWKSGQRAEAVAAWKEALTLDPENEVIRKKIEKPGF